MFYRPLNEAVWNNFKSLSKSRRSSGGIKLSLDSIYGWGIIISLRIGSDTFISIFITEYDLNNVLNKFFPSMYLGSLTAKEIYSLIPFFTASLASIFGNNCHIIDAYLLELEVPNLLLKFELPEEMEEEVFKGFSIYIYDANIDIILDYVKDWEVIEGNPTLSKISINCILELSRVTLSESNILLLSENKVILLDSNPNMDPQKGLTAFLFYEKRISEFTCNSIYDKPSIKCIKIYKEGLEQEEIMADDILTKEKILGEGSVRVLASVGQVKMTLEDLQKLSEGQIIEDGVELYNSVYLIAKGVVIAKGELFWLNTQWAVRVIEVVKNFSEVDKLNKHFIEDSKNKEEEEFVS